MSHLTMPGVRVMPQTGVIYVMARDMEHGFSYSNTDWANLGQGAPETGDIPGTLPRIDNLSFGPLEMEYTAVQGLRALREKVADYYNALFRVGKSSQYTYENVAIAGGGRVALSRIAASLGDIHLGHFLPDYTAYAELLSVFKAFVPIPLLLSPDKAYLMSQEELRAQIEGLGLRALLFSNPCNPTGQVLNETLRNQWLQVARDTQCTFIADEFYSHYLYGEESGQILSFASSVEDVNQDPIFIVDGLTKNWRYPGFRLSWTLGPKEAITQIASAGSFLDGGANHPLQMAALSVLDPENAHADATALQTHFRGKRDYMVRALRDMGFAVELVPEGAFYLWVSVAHLPGKLATGMGFFEEALKEKVIVVPGEFFDVNPGKRRVTSRFTGYVRMSFGPELASLQKGIAGIQRMIARQTI